MTTASTQVLRITVLFIVSLNVFVIAPSVFAQEPDWWTKQKQRCGLPRSLAYNTWEAQGRPCPAQNSGNTTSNSSDNGEAARQAEEKRRADEKAEREAEDQRIADEKKRKEDAAKRQADFEKARDEALQTLRGSGGGTTIRGGDTGGTGIRDSRTGTGIRESSPSSDPMVVNAQNVSSGLSKGVDIAIADLYKDAPAGVADRVRKGFQAVMGSYPDHWKDAKAWFQDALNHDPTNIGLKRFVALCDYTYTRPKLATATPVQPAPKPTMSETDREAYLKILSREEDRIILEDYDRLINDFYLNYVPKHPELKLRVIVKPAAPTLPKPYEATIETFIQGVRILVSPPKRKRVTMVSAVRG